MNEQSEAARMNGTCPSAGSVRLGRCRQCGDWIPEDEVDGLGGHCRATDDGNGYPEPTHCGPVDFDDIPNIGICVKTHSREDTDAR